MRRRRAFARWPGIGIAVFIAVLGSIQAAPAASALSNGGPVQVQLHFRVIIPQILYLQVGEAGRIPGLIEFNVTGPPGTGAVAGAPETIPVKVAAQVPNGQPITLLADSSIPLYSGGQAIPWQAISWFGTGDFSRGTFAGTSNQRLDQWRGSGNRTGAYSFRYDNSLAYPAGTYAGQVTYTLSSP
jgi:hypothetical protein